jgi:hypothetical protein
MCILPIEVLLWGAVGFVLLAFWSVVGHVCAPMLLAKQTMVFPSTSLGNLFIKGDHLPLGNVTWFSAALGPFMILVSQNGFSMFSRASKSFLGTVAPLSLHWSCQFLGTILRMWLARSASSKGPVIFIDFDALGE